MLFLWNILLAFVWCLLYGRLTPASLAAGFVMGFFILRMSVGSENRAGYFSRPWRLLAFLLYFLKEMFLAQLKVAYDIVTPANRSSPAIIGIPLDARTDAEIAVLGCVISLTPGTVCLDVSEDRRTLWVHVMFLRNGDAEALRKDIKRNLERRILEIMR